MAQSAVVAAIRAIRTSGNTHRAHRCRAAALQRPWIHAVLHGRRGAQPSAAGFVRQIAQLSAVANATHPR